MKSMIYLFFMMFQEKIRFQNTAIQRECVTYCFAALHRKYTDEWAELWKPWIMENILEWYLWYSPYLLELIDSREILGTGTKSDLLTWQRFRELFLFGNFNPCVSAGLFPALTGCGIFTNCNRCQLLDLSCLKDIWMLSKTYSEFLGQ